MASPSSTASGLVQLYQDHHAWLVRWLCRHSGGLEQAQDLAQDTFLRLLDRPSLTEGMRHPRAWLARTANNLAIDQARRRLLEQHYLEQLALLPEPEHPSPEAQLALLELLEQIDRLLDGLRPVEKQAFLMSRLDGLTYPTIATRLGVSLSSVEKYMARAMLTCYAATYGDTLDSRPR